MKIAVLDAATLGPMLDLSVLKAAGECFFYDNTPDELVAERLAGMDVAALNKRRLNAQVLSVCPSLKLICVFATGYDVVDVGYCREHGIAVCNVEGYSTESVAQVTMAMALSLSCHLPQYEAFVRNGSYTRSGVANRLEPVYHEISGQTWGIVGMGHIGTRVGEIASAMGCRVIGFRRHPGGAFSCTDLETLLRESDIVSLHVPLNDQTRGMIGEKQLSLMKKNAVLINAARGAVTDESAVAKAITEGCLGGFGTDVYSSEPMPQDHPFQALLSCGNVCFTPHMAWGSLEARERVVREVCENIRAFERGERRFRVD